MAANWKQVALGDVAEDLTVGFVGTMANEYVNSGVTFLRSQNVEPYRINLEDAKFISKEFHKKIGKSSLQVGDVVIVRTGKPGTAAVVPEGLGELNCSDLVIVRPGPKIHPWFLCYYINGIAGHHVSSHLVGAVQQHFNVGSARTLPINLPSIQEQRAIVHVLHSLDEKIELNRRMNETLESMAHALFKSWFIDFDPVRAKVDGRWKKGQSLTGLPSDYFDLFPVTFKLEDGQEIPSSWNRVPAKDIIEFNPSESLAKNANAPYLDMAALPTQGSWPDEWIRRPFGSGMKFRNGDTLFARITPCLENGKTAYLQLLPDSEVGWGSTEYIVMRAKPPVPLPTTYLLARLPEFREHAKRSMTGTSGRQRAQGETVSQFAIAAPSDEYIWNAFGRIVSPIFHSIKVYSESSSSLTEIRNTLLPTLVSGDLRISDAEKFLAERGL